MELAPGLKRGLRAGEKRHYLRKHLAELQAYYSENGREATLKHYNTVSPTLDRYLKMNPDSMPKRTVKQRTDERIEIAMAKSTDAVRNVKRLENKFGQFTDIVTDKFGEVFFKPWLDSNMAKLDIPDSLSPGVNPLDISEEPTPALIKRTRMLNRRATRITPKRRDLR